MTALAARLHAVAVRVAARSPQVLSHEAVRRFVTNLDKDPTGMVEVLLLELAERPSSLREVVAEAVRCEPRLFLRRPVKLYWLGYATAAELVEDLLAAAITVERSEDAADEDIESEGGFDEDDDPEEDEAEDGDGAEDAEEGQVPDPATETQAGTGVRVSVAAAVEALRRARVRVQVQRRLVRVCERVLRAQVRRSLR